MDEPMGPDRFDRATPEMIADPSLGMCSAMRPGCRELGPWLPFYRCHVCTSCLSKDEIDVMQHRRPAWWPHARTDL